MQLPICANSFLFFCEMERDTLNKSVVARFEVPL